jgi:hypothetical protein
VSVSIDETTLGYTVMNLLMEVHANIPGRQQDFTEGGKTKLGKERKFGRKVE